MKYVGKGAFVVGYPARDLTAAEVKRLGGVDAIMRNAPGLYVKPRKVVKPAPKLKEI